MELKENLKKNKVLKSKKAADNKNSIIKSVFFFVLVLFVIAGIISVKIYYEYLQFAEIGLKYIYVFFTSVTAKAASQAASFVIVFLFFLVNNIALRHILFNDNKDLTVIKRPVWLVIITLIIAFFASGVISDNVYQNFLTFSNNVKFNQTDPIFNQDLSYYIFERPFYIAVVNSIKGILMLNIAYTLFIYVLLQLRDGINSIGSLFENKGVLVHCVINVMLYIVAIALSYKFAREDILFGSFSGVTGAGFTDVQIWSLYYSIAPLFLIVIVPLVIYFLKKAKYVKAIISVSIFPLVWILAFVAATINQSVIVDSDELAIEQPYIQYNVDMTRKAYNLDTIEEKVFEVKNDLSYKDIAGENSVISGVAVADMSEYNQAVNKQQSLGNYYTFSDSDLVPYEVEGSKTFVAVSARELDNEKLGKTADTYVNKTFKYTHGTGVAVSDIRLGNSQYIVKDIPVLSDVGFPKIDQPRIYYGEKMNNPVVVNTRYDEVDYMNAERSTYSYQGFGGIQMTPLNRAVFSICEKDYQMLVSSQVTSESRALVNRNVVERVKKIAPFFSYDSDPYIIITDNGDLKWIVDVYAVTNQYPYSTTLNGNLNYIRCPAKAVVDAYNGIVNFYITDRDDIFVKTYQKIYPTLFEQGDIPDEIMNHVRYPQDIFKIQAEMYRRYHVTDAAALYDKNDMWDFAKEKGKKGDTQAVNTYYNIGSDGGVLTALYTSHQTDNINAWFTVGSDKDNYGKMTLWKVNKSDETACSTMYAENIINSNEIISEQLTLLAQSGAQVTVGNIQAIPIRNTLLYISPVYTTNTGNSAAYPELKKVIVVYGDKAAIENSLTDALLVIFGKKPTATEESAADEESIHKLINDIIELYDSVKQYNSANDWENAGKAMAEFDMSISELKDRRWEIEGIEMFVGPPVASKNEEYED